MSKNGRVLRKVHARLALRLSALCGHAGAPAPSQFAVGVESGEDAGALCKFVCPVVVVLLGRLGAEAASICEEALGFRSVVEMLQQRARKLHQGGKIIESRLVGHPADESFVIVERSEHLRFEFGAELLPWLCRCLSSIRVRQHRTKNRRMRCQQGLQRRRIEEVGPRPSRRPTEVGELQGALTRWW